MSFKRLVALFFAAFTFAVVGCSDDKIVDPEGVATLNMYNETNGKTLLGDSDVYINSSNNFTSRSCSVFDLGRKANIGAIGAPSFKQPASEIAAIENHAYLVCPSFALHTFPSGQTAIAIASEYYKVFVVDDIEREETRVGSVVRFLLETPRSYNLPEFDSSVSWELSQNQEYYDIPLSTSDFECELLDSKDLISIKRRGKTLRLLINNLNSFDPQNETFIANIRIGSSYTTLRFSFTW